MSAINLGELGKSQLESEMVYSLGFRNSSSRVNALNMQLKRTKVVCTWTLKKNASNNVEATIPQLKAKNVIIITVVIICNTQVIYTLERGEAKILSANKQTKKIIAPFIY